MTGTCKKNFKGNLENFSGISKFQKRSGLLVISFSVVLYFQITPSKPLTAHLKDSPSQHKVPQHPYSMAAPHGRSPARPSSNPSNDSCTMVHGMENGNGNGTSNRGKSTPKGSEKKDRDSMSPLSVKQEPTSPNEDVGISTELRTTKM